MATMIATLIIHTKIEDMSLNEYITIISVKYN